MRTLEIEEKIVAFPLMINEEPLLSRRRHSYVPVLPGDRVAWRRGTQGREEVFRCPFDDHEWLTRGQYDEMLAMLGCFSVMYTSRSGHKLITKPQPYEYGYRAHYNLRGPRKPYIYVDDRWVLVEERRNCLCCICMADKQDTEVARSSYFQGPFFD